MANIKRSAQTLKSEIISVRCSDMEKKELEKRANKNKQSVSSYLLEKGMEKRKYTQTAKRKKKAEQMVKATEIIKQLKFNMKVNYADEDTYALLEEMEGVIRKLWDC